MELSDEEIKILYAYFLRNGWVDRDWEHGDKCQTIIKKIGSEYFRLELHKDNNGRT